MATFQRHFQNFFTTLDRKLEAPVKTHLKQVYSTLAMATFAAGVGSYIHLFTDIMAGGMLAVLGSIGFAIALSVTPDNSGKNTQKRLMYLLGFAGCTGLSLGPLLELAIYVNPSIIPMALVSTFMVFSSFSLSSIFSNHAKWVYIGGSLMSLLSVLMLTSIINLFIGSYFLFQAQLYIGLIVFCVFVMYDTSIIIEKRRMGDTDHIKHAMVLFMDCVEIFKTLVVLLTQKERNSDSNRRNRRN